MPFDQLDWQVETKPLTETQRILLRAAEIIEERGWCQYVRKDVDGSHCALGAACVAMGWDPFETEPRGKRGVRNMKAALTLFAETLPPVTVRDPDHAIAQRIVDFNNAPGRTKADVVDALRGAALGRAYALRRR